MSSIELSLQPKLQLVAQAMEAIQGEVQSQIEDIFHKFGNDLVHLQAEAQRRVKMLEAELDSFKAQIEAQATKYFTLKGDLIVFHHTSQLAADINSTIAKIRKAAQDMAALAQTATKEIEIATRKAEAEGVKTVQSVAAHAQKIAAASDAFMLTVMFEEIELLKAQKLDSVVGKMCQEVALRLATGMMELVKSLATELTQQIHSIATKVILEAKKVATEAQGFAATVQKKTPGPTVVKMGVYLALEGNAFNWRTRRFEYQGRIGLVTNLVVNSVANNQISSAERKAKAKVHDAAVSFITSTIAGQMRRIGVPSASAANIAASIVSVLEEKFA